VASGFQGVRDLTWADPRGGREAIQSSRWAGFGRPSGGGPYPPERERRG
jgi:hypothetical protein